MIDIHTHLIPNLDDGSSGMDETISQLKTMSEGGVRRVYLTSHYFRGHYQYTRQEYDRHFNEVVAEVKHQHVNLELLPGFEVFLQPQILIDIKGQNLTLGDSPYILIESELNGLPNDFYTNVYPLLRAGYRPILAHAERYVSIMRKPSLAENLSHRNLYMQTNAGSLLGAYGDKVKETAWKLVNNGWTHFIASDDHVRGEYFNLFAAYSEIESQIDSHAAELLCETHPSAIASGKTIPYHYVEVIRPHRKRSWFKRLFA